MNGHGHQGTGPGVDRTPTRLRLGYGDHVVPRGYHRQTEEAVHSGEATLIRPAANFKESFKNFSRRVRYLPASALLLDVSILRDPATGTERTLIYSACGPQGQSLRQTRIPNNAACFFI